MHNGLYENEAGSPKHYPNNICDSGTTRQAVFPINAISGLTCVASRDPNNHFNTLS